MHDPVEVRCSKPHCDVSFTDSGKFSRMRAYDAGWYNEREGKWWCQAHVPFSVASWRARRRAGYTK